MKLNLKGEKETVLLDEDEDVRNIEYKSKKTPCPDNVSGGQIQSQIDANMEILKNDIVKFSLIALANATVSQLKYKIDLMLYL